MRGNNLRAQYAARNRIYFNLYLQRQNLENQKNEQNKVPSKNEKQNFWLDEEEISER